MVCRRVLTLSVGGGGPGRTVSVKAGAIGGGGAARLDAGMSGKMLFGMWEDDEEGSMVVVGGAVVVVLQHVAVVARRAIDGRAGPGGERQLQTND